MKKTAIKNYAIWARVQLIESAKQRAYEYEITENGENNPNLDAIGGRLLSKVEKEQRQQLITQIRQKGYTQVMEEAAYTWFNRFIALRFMEVNGYLPSKVRVFTDENNTFKPEILKEAMSIELDGLDRGLVLEMLDRQDNEELYKYLLIIQCNALSAGLPYMFEKIANWTELLFPTNLLRQDSVIGRLISDIDVADWNDEVEIIGWFYQYYISEKHDAVVDPLHGKVVAKEDIPAATQLFTTDWVVRYILDNSLGRYWIERHPESKLAEKLTYFITPKDGNIPTVNENISPEELKVLDPCVGSGHFLSYAFDILLEIYCECGWSDRDAARSIVENNLYGLDIDDRAAQLACFAVMMKARKYNRRIISADTKLHIVALQDSTFMTDELIKYVARRDASISSDLNDLRIVFNNAKEYGSIIIAPQIDYAALYARIQEIESTPVENLLDVQYQQGAIAELLPLIRQAEILTGKYDVVATNPPYMNKYSARLKSYISEQYEEYKGDLFSVFVYRNFGFCKPNGYSGFMTPMVWMFILTYEKLREYIISQKAIVSLIQFEYSAFEEATVPICSFILQNSKPKGQGFYFKLSDFRGGMEIQKNKVLEAISNPKVKYYYEANQTNYCVVPSKPIAYWLSDVMFEIFKTSQTLSEVAKPRQGLATSDNDRFLRFWYEVGNCKIGFGITGIDDNEQYKYKWFPCTKGGNFRRWYGNNIFIINWENGGEEIKDYAASLYKNYTRTIKNIPFYFKKGLTWSTISSGLFSLRYVPSGFIFETKGAMCFVDDKYLYSVLALYNTKVMQSFLQVISPTLDYHEGALGRTPIKLESNIKIDKHAKECVLLSKSDWDSFETSWDFQHHPLVVDRCEYHDQMKLNCNAEARRASVSLISKRFIMWEATCDERFNQLKANEEELNRIFIDIYGLQNELTPDVDDKDVTVRKADLGRDIRSLISYAVGCMMGRYSLDKPGLAFAGGEFSDQWTEISGQYYLRDTVKLTDHCPLPTAHFSPAHFSPDLDGILPITDDEYFDDDIVGMFVKWVRTVYGADTLEENLSFIAYALQHKELPTDHRPLPTANARSVIRQHFLNEFYAEHLKI